MRKPPEQPAVGLCTAGLGLSSWRLTFNSQRAFRYTWTHLDKVADGLTRTGTYIANLQPLISSENSLRFSSFNFTPIQFASLGLKKQTQEFDFLGKHKICPVSAAWDSAFIKKRASSSLSQIPPAPAHSDFPRRWANRRNWARRPKFHKDQNLLKQETSLT